MYDNATPPDEEMPVIFEHIEAHQQLDKALLALPGDKELFHSKTFPGADKTQT